VREGTRPRQVFDRHPVEHAVDGRHNVEEGQEGQARLREDVKLAIRAPNVMSRIVLCLALALCARALPAQNPSATNGPTVARPARVSPQRFEFEEGDRIVFLGDPWIGDEDKDGYIETMLTSRSGGKKPIFRNLAWSAESVASRSKGSFDPLEKGLKRLKGPLQAIKPTVAFLAYGMAESRDGAARLERFKGDIHRLMDTVTNLSSPAQVRFVIVTPPCYEAPPGAPAEAAAHNAQLELYAKALRDIAASRNARLVDLFEAMRAQHSRRGARNWTEDGMHPSPYGYWQIAGVFEGSLNLFPGFARMGIGRNNSVRRGSGGVMAENITGAGGTLRFTGKDEFVFRPLEPKRSGQTNGPDGFWMQFYPLPSGKYTLKIDGDITAVFSGAQWMDAVMLRQGPFFDRVEALRRAILKKNEMCVPRSRTADRTYLFGFRKNKNAQEKPMAHPLISPEEEKIFRLTQLKTRQYELAPSQPADEEKLKARAEQPLTERNF